MANPNDVKVRERKKQETPKKEEPKKSNKALIIVLIVLILALVGVIAWLLLSQKSSPEPEGKANASEDPTGGRGFVVDRDTVDTVMPEVTDKVQKGMFECKMNMTWNYTGGGAESLDAYVANSANNNYTIYFDVVDDATGETLYKSPFIPVGQEIQGFPLDKKLEAGSYEATVKYTLVDQDNDYAEVSSAAFIITINVSD